jgi:SET domain-containing protein
MFKQYLKVSESKLGKGVYSTIIIPAGQPILEMSGPVLLDREITIEDYSEYWQVGPNTYIGLSGGIEDHINHSCDPNCYLHIVGNRAILYSLYVIQPNMELTVDYSVNSTDFRHTWQMECKCGSNKCRKNISGHHYLSADLKDNYEHRGILPLYVVEPEMIAKR